LIAVSALGGVACFVWWAISDIDRRAEGVENACNMYCESRGEQLWDSFGGSGECECVTPDRRITAHVCRDVRGDWRCASRWSVRDAEGTR
jgi:hypothetical protein